MSSVHASVCELACACVCVCVCMSYCAPLCMRVCMCCPTCHASSTLSPFTTNKPPICVITSRFCGHCGHDTHTHAHTSNVHAKLVMLLFVWRAAGPACMAHTCVCVCVRCTCSVSVFTAYHCRVSVCVCVCVCMCVCMCVCVCTPTPGVIGLYRGKISFTSLHPSTF